jgi:hypothetical protein
MIIAEARGLASADPGAASSGSRQDNDGEMETDDPDVVGKLVSMECCSGTGGCVRLSSCGKARITEWRRRWVCCGNHEEQNDFLALIVRDAVGSFQFCRKALRALFSISASRVRALRSSTEFAPVPPPDSRCCRTSAPQNSLDAVKAKFFSFIEVHADPVPEGNVYRWHRDTPTPRVARGVSAGR